MAIRTASLRALRFGQGQGLPDAGYQVATVDGQPVSGAILQSVCEGKEPVGRNINKGRDDK